MLLSFHDIVSLFRISSSCCKNSFMQVMYKVFWMTWLCFLQFTVEIILYVTQSVFGFVTQSLGILCQHFSMFACNSWYRNIECGSFLLWINIETRRQNCCFDMSDILRSWGNIDHKQLWTFLHNLLIQNITNLAKHGIIYTHSWFQQC